MTKDILLALIPQPLLPKWEKGSQVKVPLPERERDLECRRGAASLGVGRQRMLYQSGDSDKILRHVE
jgi:hypothetical protein